jgi:hypothetical protein
MEFLNLSAQTLSAMVLFSFSLSAGSILPWACQQVTDADIQPGVSIVWEPESIDYHGQAHPAYRYLKEFVFVDSGAVLVIRMRECIRSAVALISPRHEA